jgi:hypothetical protein
MMIPDCHRRIVAAHAELKQLTDAQVLASLPTYVIFFVCKAVLWIQNDFFRSESYFDINFGFRLIYKP